jgi:hypothetical protein
MTSLVRWGCLSHQSTVAVQVSPSLHGTSDAVLRLRAVQQVAAVPFLTAMHPLGASRGDALPHTAAVASRL